MPHFPRGTDEQWQAAMEAAADRVVAGDAAIAALLGHSDDRLRDELLDAVHEAVEADADSRMAWRDQKLVVFALLPVVRAYGDLRAAEELRAAADDADLDRRYVRAWLRNRAAALTAREEAGR